jgi:hypothetical protein
MIYDRETKRMTVTHNGKPLELIVVWYPGHALDNEDFAFAVVDGQLCSASYYVHDDYVDMELFGWAEISRDAGDVVRELMPDIDQNLIDAVVGEEF